MSSRTESCYEFALGLETTEQSSDDTKPTVKPVNRNEVFRKLNWILSTVKIATRRHPGQNYSGSSHGRAAHSNGKQQSVNSNPDKRRPRSLQTWPFCLRDQLDSTSTR